MKTIPVTEKSPVLRTDFHDQAAWESICEQMQRPSSDGFLARVEFIDDPVFEGLSKLQLLAYLPEEYPRSFILVVDHVALFGSERTLLVINLYDGLIRKLATSFAAYLLKFGGSRTIFQSRTWTL